MHNLIIILKSLAIFCIAWFTEILIGSVTMLSFVPVGVKEFCEEVKTPLAVLVSFAIFILTVIRIIKENKKEK